MTFRFSSSNDVRHTLVSGVLLVTIDRPDKRNALSLGVLDSLRHIFTDVAGDTAIKVAVIRGAGAKAFASGGDLTELAAYREREDAEALSRHGKAALDAIRLFPAPVIARMQGVALGGGAELALACDLRMASASCRLGFVHGRLCISPAWGGGRDLVRIVGPAKALYLMASAAVLDASAAQAMGLVNLVGPEDPSFDTWFEERLALFRDQPAQVLRAYKAITGSSRATDAEPAERVERESFCSLWCHDDHWNALRKLEGGRP